jgi:aspartokinase/homoserine dehydrogenase 1
MTAHDPVVSKPASPAPAATQAAPASVIAHKFGGSSLADATRMRAVADLLRARDDAVQVVVVSALQGVTDTLIALTADAASHAAW